MTWEQVLPLIPAGLIPTALILYLQHLGFWGSSRELAILRQMQAEEKARAQFWIDKYEVLLRQSEVNTDALQEATTALGKATAALQDAAKIVERVTR